MSDLGPAIAISVITVCLTYACTQMIEVDARNTESEAALLAAEQAGMKRQAEYDLKLIKKVCKKEWER